MPLAFKVIEPAAAAPLVVPTKLTQPAVLIAALTLMLPVAPHAEKNGVILGIESYLSADEQIEIIDQVGSKNVKIYYDFCNVTDAGLDTVKEFKKLGKDRICELHMKENGFLLGEGVNNWKAN